MASSYVQGRTQAGVVRPEAADFTQRFNNLNEGIKAEKQKATAQQKRIEEINALAAKGWNNGQKIVDEKIEAIKKRSMEALKNGDGNYNYDDLREIQEMKQNLVGQVEQQAIRKAEHDEHLKNVARFQAQHPDLYDQEATIRNYSEQMFKIDPVTGEPMLDENGEPVQRTDYENMDFDNLIVAKEVQAPELSTNYKKVDGVYDISGSSIENDKGTKTVSSKSKKLNLNSSFHNWITTPPSSTKTERIDNKAVLDRDAKEKGYKDWKDWQEKDKKGMQEHVRDNYLNLKGDNSYYGKSVTKPSGGGNGRSNKNNNAIISTENASNDRSGLTSKLIGTLGAASDNVVYVRHVSPTGSPDDYITFKKDGVVILDQGTAKKRSSKTNKRGEVVSTKESIELESPQVAIVGTSLVLTDGVYAVPVNAVNAPAYMKKAKITPKEFSNDMVAAYERSNSYTPPKNGYKYVFNTSNGFSSPIEVKVSGGTSSKSTTSNSSNKKKKSVW